jgi:PAS domain S-box-containing protein
MTTPFNNRILIVDDNPAIHDDFRKILIGNKGKAADLQAAESILFDAPKSAAVTEFFVESAFQGREALDKVTQALSTGRQYALAFVDVRMPPGWDGVETISRLWEVDPSLQIVVCTAYSDYSWEKMTDKLGVNDNLVILKKPFDNIEVVQLAHALTKKWHMTRQAAVRVETLDRMVTERTREIQTANAELRRSEERFAKAFRASPIPLAIQTVHEERFVDVNDSFVSMTGFSRGELIDRTPLDLRLCFDYGTTPPNPGMGKPIRHIEAQIGTRAGDLRNALVSMEPINIGGVPHQLVMALDVTERLQLENQLRQSQKMEAIGQLAAGVAHDFNNLLTIIQGHASLQLNLAGHNAEATASFEEIAHAADRAADLTRQLLAFSRRQIMRPSALDLNGLIRNLSSMLRRLIGERIELRCDFATDLPSIWADQTGIEQIVMNLALNARDAIPKSGHITIATGTAHFTEADAERNREILPGDYVALSVSDNGTGMDEATRRRIFEPFFTTKPAEKGTGMGLATVYGTTKQHEGWIDVTTEVGVGSTFRVFLPITAHHPEKTGSNPETPGPCGGERTVLVVEDDESVRSLVKEVLLHNRYRVIEAQHADAALIAWEDHADEIDLLLTDMIMPGDSSGLELAQQLLASKPDLKVIYTSGYSTELFGKELTLLEGMNYLPKPYISAQLAAILRNAFDPSEVEIASGALPG